MSGLVDVGIETAAPAGNSVSIISSEETKGTTATVPETVNSDSSVSIGTLPGENVPLENNEKAVVVEEKQQEQIQQQPREELEIVQKANEDDEVIGDVVDQFDKAVTLNPQNTNSLQQIQAVQSHLSAGRIDHSYVLLPIVSRTLSLS